METGGWLAGLTIFGGLGLGVLLVRRWTKSGKAPPTSLKCLNCPGLVERIRQLWVAVWCLVAVEMLTLFWLYEVWSMPR